MRKLIKKTGTVILAIAVLWGTTVPSFAARKQFNIGTGFIGSSMHSLGTVLAKHMQKDLRMRVTARPYVGPSAFIPLINNGELEMGLSSMGEANAAYRGIGTDPKKDVRAVARLFAMPFAFIVREDSDIRNVADLKGKRVVADFAAAQAMNDMTQTMLNVANVGRDEVNVVTVSGVGQGIETVVEGNADAAPGSVSMAAVRKADASVGIRVVNLDAEGYEDRMGDAATTGIRSFEVKAGSYPGVSAPSRIFALDIFLVVPKELEDEDVNKILDVLHNKWADMQKDFNGLNGFSLEEFVHSSQTVPYHPAAIKYYKDGKGKAVWGTAAEERNQNLLDVWN